MLSLAQHLSNKSIALHLLWMVGYDCGCFDSRPPWEATKISLLTFEDGSQRYFYPDQYCYKCNTRYENRTMVSRLPEQTEEKAIFKCGHWSSRLPLVGEGIQLRWTLDGRQKDLPHYQWPITCYYCERMYSIHRGPRFGESFQTMRFTIVSDLSTQRFRCNEMLTWTLIVECVRKEDERLEILHRYAVTNLEARITTLENCLQRGQWIGTQPITEVERRKLETRSSRLRMECMNLVHNRKSNRDVHRESLQEQWGYGGEHVF